jgi:hypothetical protein
MVEAAGLEKLVKAAAGLPEPSTVLDELTALENALNMDDVVKMAEATKRTSNSLKK